MIPQRVTLAGFLSYRDEQEIRFDGSPLWMLSGANGSGKSSVFDAVTFALFGYHRGGSQSAGELINKDAHTLSVEFDFTIEKQLYRIKRTVRRQKNDKVASTQQVLKFIEDEAAGDSWEALSGTEYKTKFDAWVKDRIGLDYETFTSSVLLLQGKSEKLLDSTPAGRASVLARIVDLERYQKLHGKADDKRRSLKSELEGIGNHLSAIRVVTEEEYGAVKIRIAATEEARVEVQKRIDGLNELELRARRWDDAQSKLAAVKQKLAEAQKLLGSALAVERDHTRLRELRDVLPAVNVIVTERGRIGHSERSREQLNRQRVLVAEERVKTEHTLSLGRKKLAALKKLQSDDEGKKSRLETRLRELAGILEKVRQVEEAEAELKQLNQELAQLPPNPDAAVQEFLAEQQELVMLEPTINLLERLHRDRSELLKAVKAENAAKKQEARLKEDGIKAKEEFTALEEKARAARTDRAAKDQAAAEARAIARQARAMADEFQKMTGKSKCRACGQKLTAEHFLLEKTQREEAASAAEKQLATLADAAAAAGDLENDLNAREAAERERLAKMRDEYKDAAAALKQASLDSKRFAESCRQSYQTLPEAFKLKVSSEEPTDWSLCTYPNQQDLTHLETRVQGLGAVKRKLHEAQKQADETHTLKAKLESARERSNRAKQALPSGNPAELRQEQTAKQSEETAVANSLIGTKKEISSTESENERLQRSLNDAERELTEIAGKVNVEEATIKQSGEAIERAKKTLPGPWCQPLETAGLNDRAVWQDEFDALVAKGTEAKYTQLEVARGGLDPLRAEIKQLEAEEGAYLPEERRPPDDIRTEVNAARKELEQRNEELHDAQGLKRVLDDYLKQRAEMSAQFKAVDAEHNRYKLLAEMLGRDRLQRHLVRQAERQIVDHANAVLDRLSGGQLFMRLVEAEAGTDKALDLECANRVTGGTAINVAFLSGSQRFRVSVALALGIGQYASRQHRPIESVIIDEGFGCLDRAGRQVMIQELQNLSSHLHRILLVSHQEEFADAFPDGYRFELEDGTTKVRRYVK